MKYLKRFTIFYLLSSLLISCYDNQGFKPFYQEYQQQQFKAASMAEEWFLEPQKLSQKLDHCQSYLDQLSDFSVTSFSPKNKRLYKQLEAECRECLTQLEPYRKDPSLYNMGGQIKAILAQDTLTLEKRLQWIQQHLSNTEAYYGTAKQVLSSPIPAKSQLGAQKQLLALEFLDAELSDSIFNATIAPEEKEEMQLLLYNAQLSLKDYLAFCESLFFESRDSIPRIQE